jgi:hypothetical protein
MVAAQQPETRNRDERGFKFVQPFARSWDSFSRFILLHDISNRRTPHVLPEGRGQSIRKELV